MPAGCRSRGAVAAAAAVGSRTRAVANGSAGSPGRARSSCQSRSPLVGAAAGRSTVHRRGARPSAREQHGMRRAAAATRAGPTIVSDLGRADARADQPGRGAVGRFEDRVHLRLHGGVVLVHVDAERQQPAGDRARRRRRRPAPGPGRAARRGPTGRAQRRTGSCGHGRDRAARPAVRRRARRAAPPAGAARARRSAASIGVARGGDQLVVDAAPAGDAPGRAARTRARGEQVAAGRRRRRPTVRAPRRAVRPERGRRAGPSSASWTAPSSAVRAPARATRCSSPDRAGGHLARPPRRPGRRAGCRRPRRPGRSARRRPARRPGRSRRTQGVVEGRRPASQGLGQARWRRSSRSAPSCVASISGPPRSAGTSAARADGAVAGAVPGRPGGAGTG